MCLKLRGFCSSTGCRCLRRSTIIQVFPGLCSRCLQMLCLGSDFPQLGFPRRTPQGLEWSHLHAWLPLSVESWGGFTGGALMEKSGFTSHAQDQQQSNSWPRCLEVMFPLNSTAGFRLLRLPERPPPWSFNPSPSVLPATCSLNLVTGTPSPATLAGHLAANEQACAPSSGPP